MIQRDYFMRQVEQFSRMLAKLLSKLVGIKETAYSTTAALDLVNQTFINGLGTDIDNLLAIDTDSFIESLTVEKGLSDDNLNHLAEIFLFLADNKEEDDEQRKKLYSRALLLFVYLQDVDDTFSVQRQFNIERIKELFSIS